MFEPVTERERTTGCGVSVALPLPSDALPQYRNTCPLAPTLIVVSTAQNELRFSLLITKGEATVPRPFSTSYSIFSYTPATLNCENCHLAATENALSDNGKKQFAVQTVVAVVAPR